MNDQTSADLRHVGRVTVRAEKAEQNQKPESKTSEPKNVSLSINNSKIGVGDTHG